MTEMRALRVAGWNGIVFSVLSLVVLPLIIWPPAEPPVLGSTPEAFGAWFAAHRTGFLIGNYLGFAAFVPGLVQLAVLVARIRAREGTSGFFAPLVLASGVFAYAVAACSLVAFQAMPFLVDRTDVQAMRAVGTLGEVWFALDGLAVLPMVVAVGWAALETQALPRWFASACWLLAPLALLMSVGGLVDHPAWLAGGGAVTLLAFVAFFVWTFVLGVIFLRLEPPSGAA